MAEQVLKVGSLKGLLKALDSCKAPLEYTEVAKSIGLNKEELAPYTFWEHEFYTRNCIRRTSEYELILICWEPGQQTPIHCHGHQECWVHIVEGTFVEKRYELVNGKPKAVSEFQPQVSGLTYMNDDMGHHSLHNSPTSRGMTLHLYSKPINQCQIFNPIDEIFQWKQMCYYTLEGKSNN